MRVVHFSDTHLGYSDYGKFDSQSGVNQRELDTYNVFRDMVDYIIATKPDLVIHAGDLFDSIRPSNRAISEAMIQLFRLSKEGIPTVIIAGNHSTPRLRSTDSIFSVLKFFPNIYPISEGKYAKVEIGDCAIHAIPHMYSDDELKNAVEQLNPDSKFKFNVMVAHAAVRGSQIASWGEFKEQTLPLEALKPEFDYIALGHYHRFLQIRGTKNAYYSGSPERFSFNEVADKKGFIEVELESFAVKQIPTKARDMVIFDPINCSDLSAAEVMNEFAALVDGKLGGKIAKVIFKNISREVHSALDMTEIKNLVRGALHYEPEYQWKSSGKAGRSATSRIGSLSEEFLNFVKAASLSGAEKKEMIELGSAYLHDVIEEEEAIVSQ